MKEVETRKIFIHLILAGMSGVIVFGTIAFASWYSLRDSSSFPYLHKKRYPTLGTLRNLTGIISDYKKENGKLPEKLSGLVEPQIELEPADLLLYREHFEKDGWGNLIQYEITGETYDLFSFGRDGKLGGIGLDVDLYSDARNYENRRVTFSQFFFEDGGGQYFIPAAQRAGIIVALTVLVSLQIRNRKTRPLNRRQLVTSVITIIIAACLGGIFLLPLHIPSGH